MTLLQAIETIEKSQQNINEFENDVNMYGT